ncbi:LysR family transcriptional regulator [Shewanella youngdeokensis]|uniref:LysR substrate-binding domain-containing protein n=1 Tax=Shewanella youngdeokensis TaxID=2999068 RepID=A0ABZ0JY04_9GAMM|nr:LysR substrate-binding domain-containing protein [Shewanella sp. DAU334]
MNLHQIDLNLLITLKHLLEEKHVSNTALQLSISQPTVSRSLNRLRKLFNDLLLVKTANGYELTPKAQSIKLELNTVLSSLEDLIKGKDFDPATSNNTVRLFGLSPQMEFIAPLLLKHVREHAPNMIIELDTIPQPHFAALHAGDCHFVLSCHTPQVIDQNLHSMTLLQRDYCLVMSSNHPLAHQPLTMDNLRQCQFGQISLQGDKQLSLEPNFQAQDGSHFSVATPVRLTNFSCAAGIAEATDIIFHLPKRYAESICVQRELVMRQVPKPLIHDNTELKLYWHKRFHNDPMCSWIRNALKTLTQNTK